VADDHVPAAQSVQAVSWPVVTMYLPASQLMQPAWPVAVCLLPAGQSVHEPAIWKENLPLAHAVQAAEFTPPGFPFVGAAMAKPAAHFVQIAAPSTGPA